MFEVLVRPVLISTSTLSLAPTVTLIDKSCFHNTHNNKSFQHPGANRTEQCLRCNISIGRDLRIMWTERFLCSFLSHTLWTLKCKRGFQIIYRDANQNTLLKKPSNIDVKETVPFLSQKLWSICSWYANLLTIDFVRMHLITGYSTMHGLWLWVSYTELGNPFWPTMLVWALYLEVSHDFF